MSFGFFIWGCWWIGLHSDLHQWIQARKWCVSQVSSLAAGPGFPFWDDSLHLGLRGMTVHTCSSFSGWASLSHVAWCLWFQGHFKAFIVLRGPSHANTNLCSSQQKIWPKQQSSAAWSACAKLVKPVPQHRQHAASIALDAAWNSWELLLPKVRCHSEGSLVVLSLF